MSLRSSVLAICSGLLLTACSDSTSINMEAAPLLKSTLAEFAPYRDQYELDIQKVMATCAKNDSACSTPIFAEAADKFFRSAGYSAGETWLKMNQLAENSDVMALNLQRWGYNDMMVPFMVAARTKEQREWMLENEYLSEKVYAALSGE